MAFVPRRGSMPMGQVTCQTSGTKRLSPTRMDEPTYDHKPLDPRIMCDVIVHAKHPSDVQIAHEQRSLRQNEGAFPSSAR